MDKLCLIMTENCAIA